MAQIEKLEKVLMFHRLLLSGDRKLQIHFLGNHYSG